MPSALLCSCWWVSINERRSSSWRLLVSRKREGAGSPAEISVCFGGSGGGRKKEVVELLRSISDFVENPVCARRIGAGTNSSSAWLSSFQELNCLPFWLGCLAGGAGFAIGAGLARLFLPISATAVSHSSPPSPIMSG